MTGPCTLLEPDILPTVYPESSFTVEQLSGADPFSKGYPLPWPGYTVPEFGGRLNGLGNWLSDLFGKPQSWYDRIDRDQKSLAVRAAEINAFGSDAWSTVRDAYLANAQGPGIDFPEFRDINDQLTRLISSLLITKDHTPSDTEIALAESFDAQSSRYVDFVKQTIPELAAQAAADAANVTAMLSQNRMRSPAEVGEQAFEDEVARRAKILGGALGGMALIYLLGIPLLAMALSGGGRR
jgi:hypothetical protein